LAIQRGPIIYCLEDKDQEIKGRLLDVEIDKNGPLSTRWDGDCWMESWLLKRAANLLIPKHGVDIFTSRPHPLFRQITHPIRLVAIPYYAWGNRGIGGMRVWIPKK
jgi:DUF1680 family protein